MPTIFVLSRIQIILWLTLSIFLFGLPLTQAAPAASNQTAQCIVSLAPNITELLFAAGAGNRIVGVSRYSDYPEAAKSLPIVSDATFTNIETIIQLKPDLIIGWKSGNRAADLSRLQSLGFRVIIIEPTTLEDIPRLIRQFGQLAGTQPTAIQVADQFEQDLAALRHQFQQKRRLKVFYEIWHQPLMTINHQQMINSIIDLCGGKNSFAYSPMLTPTISIESVIAANPDVILIGSGPQYQASMDAWKRFNQIEAVQKNHLFYIDSDLMTRQTPRTLLGARAVCEALEKARR